MTQEGPFRDGMSPSRIDAEAREGGVQHLIETVIEHASFVIEAIAAVLLIVGAVRFLAVALGTAVTRRDHLSRALQAARLRLGAYILAGLEFLIVADILFTIVHREFQDLINLAIIAAVRTVISYFLGKELEALRAGDDEGGRQAAESMTPPRSDPALRRG